MRGPQPPKSLRLTQQRPSGVTCVLIRRWAELLTQLILKYYNSEMSSQFEETETNRNGGCSG